MSKLLKVMLGIGLLGYFCFLVVVRTPATLVTANIAKQVPMIELAVISGTAWNGRAGAAHLNIQGQVIDLGALSWTFKPLSLLSLNACVDLASDILNGNVCRSVTGINSFTNLQVELPASLANDRLPDAKLAGMGSLMIAKGSVNDRGEVSALEGNLTWRGARLNVQGMWFTLGDFAADLAAGENGAIRANIFDLAGPFGVNLDGQVGIATPPTVRGEILPREGAPDDIRDALGLFAVPQDNGAFAVSYPIGS
ncbi:MAG TPA: type II secretion system protein N [Marinagarivorans sp.]